MHRTAPITHGDGIPAGHLLQEPLDTPASGQHLHQMKNQRFANPLTSLFKDQTDNIYGVATNTLIKLNLKSSSFVINISYKILYFQNFKGRSEWGNKSTKLISFAKQKCFNYYPDILYWHQGYCYWIHEVTREMFHLQCLREYTREITYYD